MNSYERIMSAMHLLQPDRVPISEFLIDPKVYKALMPTAREQSDFEVAYGLDTVTAKATYKIIKDMGKTFIDEWGVLYKRNEESVSFPVESPIKTYKDFLNHTLPDPDEPTRLGRLEELVSCFKKEKAILFNQRASFLWSTYLVGMDTLLIDFIEKPEFVHELMDKVLDISIKLARNAVRAGADIIVVTDDYAYNSGTLFSPKIFREFIYPSLKKFVDAVHEENGLVVKHTDGYIMDIIDDIIDTGIDALNPIDPLAGMDIKLVKEKYGKKIAIWGNIDCSNLMTFGNVNDVEQAVKDCISKAAPGGGYVLTSSNTIHSSVKPENYDAMLKFGKLYGNYPISIQ